MHRNYPKFLIALIAIVIITVDCALIFIAQRDKASRLAQVEETLQRAIDTLSDQMDVEFDLFSRTLTGIGEAIAIHEKTTGLDELTMHRLLLRRNAVTPNLRSIIFIQSDGALAAHSLNFPVGKLNFSDRDYFHAQIERFDHGLYIGSSVESRFDKIKVVPLSIRVTSDGGRFLGIAGASIRSERLSEILASLNLPPQYSLKLLLNNGSTLACFPLEDSCTKNIWLNAPLFTQHLLANRSATIWQASLFGEMPGLATYKTSKQFPFVMAGYVNPKHVLQAWYESLIEYVLIGIFSNLALVFLGIYAIRQFNARQLALAKLHETNLLLESRVLERTEELRRSEHRINQIFAGSPIAMILVNQESQISKINQQAQYLFEGSEAELIGQPIEALYPVTLRSAYKAHLEHYWQRPYTGITHREYLAAKLNGKEFPAEIGLGLIEVNHDKFIVLAIHDISERKTVQIELNKYRNHLEEMVHARTVELAQARDEATSASRAKSAILANMSHELRTPMHQIIGLTQIIQRRATDDSQKNSLSNLAIAAKRLMQLIEELLDLARIESGSLILEPRPFDLQNLLHEAAEQVQDEALNKGLRLRVENDPKLPKLLLGDAYRIKEIFACLLKNAIKFSSAGEIIISSQLLEQQPLLFTVRFEIQDQGIGIAPEDQLRLFQSFTQIDDSQTRKFGGAGLGLSLSKRLVDLMGGQIGVQSQESSGSTFWIILNFPCINEALN